MRIKRLNTDYWMEDRDMRENCVKGSSSKHTPCSPIFGKPGIYKVGNKCWFETTDGMAFTYPVKYFIHTLKTINASFLDKRKINALKMIIEAGLSTQQQKDLYYFSRHADEIKMIRRSAYIHYIC